LKEALKANNRLKITDKFIDLLKQKLIGKRITFMEDNLLDIQELII
jgi:hypothetical protein